MCASLSTRSLEIPLPLIRETEQLQEPRWHPRSILNVYIIVTFQVKKASHSSQTRLFMCHPRRLLFRGRGRLLQQPNLYEHALEKSKGKGHFQRAIYDLRELGQVEKLY